LLEIGNITWMGIDDVFFCKHLFDIKNQS
jgi:hypothetical protein